MFSIKVDTKIGGCTRFFVLTAFPPRAARKALGEHPEHKGVHVRDLIRAGLLKPPLELERLYKGVVLKATVQVDGSIVCDGESYASLSTAAGMARKTVVGAPPGRRYPQTNGWIFWRYRNLENDKLEKVDVLRQAVKRGLETS